MKKKLLIPIMVLVLLIGAVGGTLAWLTDKTETITNTFTVGNIDIDLTEKTGDEYKMVPGNVIAKDPVVTVKEGNEACWLFVKVEKSANFDAYLTYQMADGWTPLKDATGTDVDGVFYREVAANTGLDNCEVLKDSVVNVNGGVTKDMMDAIDGVALDDDGNEIEAPDELANRPTLKFTGYAVQKDGFATAALAWAEVSAQ